MAENIVKNFGSFKALNNVSLQVPKGSIFGLLGPNGAGKTTFIRIINQITMPDEGLVWFDGKPLVPDDVHYIGYLPEERGLYKRMKIGEQALYLAQLKGMSKAEANTGLPRLQACFLRVIQRQFLSINTLSAKHSSFS